MALVLLVTAELGTLAFSFISGFSIGRFTAIIPVLLSGYVIGIGRSRVAVGAFLFGAAALSFFCSWLLTPVGFSGGLAALLFGFWAIPLYVVRPFRVLVCSI